MITLSSSAEEYTDRDLRFEVCYFPGPTSLER